MHNKTWHTTRLKVLGNQLAYVMESNKNSNACHCNLGRVTNSAQ